MESFNNCGLLLRIKQTHEFRFFNILYVLSDTNVEWKFCRAALNYLTQHDFFEISDSRSSNDLCGYVLCDKEIKLSSKATVRLDVTNKKIYNIEKRKQFCSDWCYGAHRHIISQLPIKAEWYDDKSVRKSSNFSLYSKDAIGCKGDLINDENSGELDESNNIIVNDQLSDEQSDLNESNEGIEHDGCENQSVNVQRIIPILNKLSVEKKKQQSKKSLDEVLKKVRENQEKNKPRKIVFLKDYVEGGSDDLGDNKSNGTFLTTSNNDHGDAVMLKLDNVVKKVFEWITDKTHNFILGSDEKDVEVNKKQDYTECDIIMPPLDCIDNDVLRMNIIVKRIQTCSKTIVRDFGLDMASFIRDLVKFIKTCRLTSTNIMFSVEEVHWLTIFLICTLYPNSSKIESIQRVVMKKHGLTNPVLFDQAVMPLRHQLYQIQLVGSY